MTSWANEVGLRSLPASAATVARYLVARHRAGATAVGQAHKAAGHPSRVAEEAVGLTIARSGHCSQAQAAPLDTPPWMPSLPRPSSPGGTPRRAGERRLPARRGTVDIALALLVSDAGLRRSEAAELKWGEVARWPDGSGRITVRRSKTDATGSGALVYATIKSSTPRTMAALDAIRPDDGEGEGLVFGGLGAAQVSRRIAAAGAHAGLQGDYSGRSPHNQGPRCRTADPVGAEVKVRPESLPRSARCAPAGPCCNTRRWQYNLNPP